MDSQVYQSLMEYADKHWWNLGRRNIIAQMIEKLVVLPKEAQILEIGCGTGIHLEMLAEFGQVRAMEMDSNIRDFALKKTNQRFEIKDGSCPDKIPFETKSFDLICMFDVLEHIEQDQETLIVLKKLLKENGYIMITVPAYQWLWSVHDDINHHKRRYSSRSFCGLIQGLEFDLIKLSYFNTFLFPLAVIAKLKDRLVPGTKPESAFIPPTKMLNLILKTIFSMESTVLKRINFPFGVSLIALLQNK